MQLPSGFCLASSIPCDCRRDVISCDPERSCQPWGVSLSHWKTTTMRRDDDVNTHATKTRRTLGGAHRLRHDKKNVQHAREIQRYHMQFGSVGPILAVTREYLVPRVYRHERSSKEKQSLIPSSRWSEYISRIQHRECDADRSQKLSRNLLSQNLSTWKIS